MAAPKQTPAPRPASRPGTGKSKDKGTRGGRPDPQPTAPARRTGNGQRRAGQAGQADQLSRPAPRPAVPADPGPGTAPGWLQPVR